MYMVYGVLGFTMVHSIGKVSFDSKTSDVETEEGSFMTKLTRAQSGAQSAQSGDSTHDGRGGGKGDEGWG